MMSATLLENPDQSACRSRREAELTALVEKLLGEVAQLRGEVARLFAAKSEKKPSKDRSNGLDDPKAAKEPRRPRGQQPDASGPGRRDHSHLPSVEEEVELPSDETACPKCGKPAAEMNETEDSEVIEVEVRAHRRKIRRKRYRRTCDCPNASQTLTAPAPPKLIPKGRYGVSVWVYLLLAKFASHRALGNAIEALSHYDLDLPQGTIFALHDAALREAIDAMHQQATEALAQPKLREPCRKALASLLDHWSGLTWFVDDPRIPMDNNASERMVRGPAMGRKNYYGSGSLWSVCLTAAMFSIVATLKQWNVNPRRWLSWYLESCAAAGSRVPEDVERFLPWNLTADRRAELTSPETSVPINDSS